MGIIHHNIPQALAQWVRQAFPVTTFIETGTNIGDTAIWASGQFDEVRTIEADPRLHEVASGRLKAHPNAEVILGMSQQVLAALLAGRPPCLLWLDAHWSGPGTSGEDHECPVLEEIRLVDASNAQHIILIDDARLFFNPPPPPHKPEHWPAIGAVVDCLRETFPDTYVTVWRDVVVRIPRDRREDFEAFCRQVDVAGGAAECRDARALDQLASEAEALRSRLALAEARCDAMLASTSWRVTAPIRALKALIGGR